LKISKSDSSEEPVVIDCRNAGTVFRFLTSFLAGTEGRWFLTGASRMKERPMQPLVDALRQLGAHITYAGRKGVPPLIIEGRPLTGGRIKINAEASSQFVSAILMIAPALPGGLELKPTR
jgi:3-phosphoshikimate 1-carboxyvinyltransferase